ncbi:plg7 [Symbiodinium sp. CCMP2592]|nr:plg7 [Symbiodinium sp. CCMP2592]
MGILSFLLRPSRPAPFGEVQKLGSVRQRLTFETTTKNGAQDLLVQAFYPAEDVRNPDAKEEPFFREQIYTEIGTKRDIPLWGLRALLDFPQIDAPLRPGKPDSSKKWPVAVFSSGLWGSCEMYTQFCRDLASLGVIVLALEHEDGSGIWATSGTGEPIPYKDPPSGSTIPEFRAPQLDQRASDLAASAFAIQSIAQSEAGHTSNTSLLAEVLRTGDANDLHFVGHSFGAAGMLTYLKDLAEKGLDCPYGSVQDYIGMALLWPSLPFSFNYGTIKLQLRVPRIVLKCLVEHAAPASRHAQEKMSRLICVPRQDHLTEMLTHRYVGNED